MNETAMLTCTYDLLLAGVRVPASCWADCCVGQATHASRPRLGPCAPAVRRSAGPAAAGSVFPVHVRLRRRRKALSAPRAGLDRSLPCARGPERDPPGLLWRGTRTVPEAAAREPCALVQLPLHARPKPAQEQRRKRRTEPGFESKLLHEYSTIRSETPAFDASHKSYKISEVDSKTIE